MSSAPDHRTGFALVSALFLLVILSLLGAYLVGIVAVQHVTPALRINASRAEYAARAMAAWAARRGSVAGVCENRLLTFGASGGSLQGFRVAISCTAGDHELGSATRRYYLIATRGAFSTFGSPDYVSRGVRVKVLAPAVPP